MRVVYENVAFTVNSLAFHRIITLITLNVPSLESVTMLSKISHTLDRASSYICLINNQQDTLFVLLYYNNLSSTCFA